MPANVGSSNNAIVNQILSATSINEVKFIVEHYMKSSENRKMEQGDIIKLYNDATEELSGLYKSTISEAKCENIIAARVYLNSHVLELLK